LIKQKQGKRIWLSCKFFGNNLLKIETEVSGRNIVDNIKENCKNMI
jgi:hypothetical protein